MIQNDWITDLYGASDTITVSASTLTTNTTAPYINTMGSSGGYVLTTSGSSGIDWSIAPNTTTTLDVKGDANFDGDVKLKGKSLSDTLNKIEERLAILHPNEALEEKWEQLKELGKQYREMEKDILEKEKIWKILKE